MKQTCLHFIFLLLVLRSLGGELEDDWNEDDPRDSRQIAFPSESMSGAEDTECLGTAMSLRAGEGTLARSHRSYGKYSYDSNYRCKWVIKPISCDLSVVCHMKTREGRGGGDRCSGADYLRIMKGSGGKVEFEKKYCGRQTASLKFTGDQTIKIIFKSGKNGRAGKLDGWSCKILCLPQQNSGSQSDSFNFSSTNTPMTTTTATTTSTSSTTISTSTSTTIPLTSSETISTTANSPKSGCECGVLPTVDGRIICPHGVNCTADPGGIPWQAGLLGRASSKPFCGGTLINSRYVLSAAHCLESATRRLPGNLFVVLGEHDWTQVSFSRDCSDISERYGVSSVLLHPEFRQGALFNFDFAIIQLNRPVDFKSYGWIRPVCLPEPDQPVNPGSRGLVSGWGVTDFSIKTQSTTLQMVYLDIMEQSNCINHYSTREITDKMLCAAAKSSDACYGDSGGPMTVQVEGRSVLTGVVSWGLECARPQWPGVYSRVSSVIPWINANTLDGDYCVKNIERNSNDQVRSVDNRGDRRS
ncbi:transmembrane protease serine 9 [Eurytemora carolleeae]|uniref:transmembrane protease serine 9 n=1 Tax=Eurytemora carolleeae TaxID=1294199 RepID=UPI000C7620C4|nr:transmembrane protease serine 9 [Eurytemora carolleeae]|eukprot:XP_023323582.1 transmembrane protease serine 9-like [Eurytemora affinis]